MAELDLLVVGDLNADVIVSDPALTVEFGQVESLVARSTMAVGGSAAITAVAAARLGLRTGLCAVVGRDPVGDFLLAQLRHEGVDVDSVRIDGATPTGMSVVLDRGGDRAILTSLGTIESLGPEDLRQIPPDASRHVHASSYFLMSEDYRSFLPEWFAGLQVAGVTTSLDTNWDPHRRWDLAEPLRHCTWYFPNEAELEAVTGTTVLGRGMEIVEELGTNVAVKRGSSGAVAGAGDRLYRVRQTPPVEFVDAVGAGDTFDAGFLAGFLTGADIGTCLAMAVTAGTLSTGGAGGTSAQPGRDLLDPLARTLVVESETR